MNPILTNQELQEAIDSALATTKSHPEDSLIHKIFAEHLSYLLNAQRYRTTIVTIDIDLNPITR